MTHMRSLIFASALLLVAAAPARANVLLDDTFADGTRNNQNLPTDAAWFVSAAANATTSTNGLALAVPSGSFMGISYFRTNSSSPVQLGVGDVLTVSLTFTFNNVAPLNTAGGFRLGLFDFADSTLSPKWVTADGFSTSSQGTNVQGYALFQNMGVTFNNTAPMGIYKRTTAADASLLGTSGDWTLLLSGPGSTNNFSGFTGGGKYRLQFAVQRTDAVSQVIALNWQNLATGATLATSVTDSAASTFNFDGLALRPSGAGSTATNMVINEVRVDLVSFGSPPVVNAQPQNQAIFAGQNATFSINAGGTAPLSYQWYFDSSTALPNATNAFLTITNAQLTDIGGYSVIVTNAFGVVASETAELTVSVPTAPVIVTPPQGLTVLPGQSASFSVSVGGSAPFGYQWFYNTSNALAGATSDTLGLTNVQPGAAGGYTVVVTNFVGATTSAPAWLMVNTNPLAPVFTTQPASQVVLAGGAAGFSATVAGTAPLAYQWSKNGMPLPGATAAYLSLTNVQTADAGNYSLTVSNSVGTTTSSTVVLTVTAAIPVVNSAYNLVGFGQHTTGGGVLADTDPAYAKVYTATDLANAINSKTVRIIEIMNDLNLGYNEIEATAKAASEPFRADATPLLHPVLLTTGVSLIDVQKKNGLTIFSANGATLRHAHLNVENSANVIIRNLKFDQLWEWDEATKGQYDRNNWDFITIGNAGRVTNMWVDHCTFTKAYDGVVDIKNGSSGITLSWCKYTGDDGYTNTNSWVWQQLNALETNKTSHAMYNFLRSNGFSESDIFAIIQGHDKTHLIGANDLDPNNALENVTLHHEWFINPGDRLPRLRAGNVHDFNIYVDDTQAIAANRLRSARQAAMSTVNQNTLNNTYDFNNFLNGSISTENGAVLVEKSVYIDCLYPLRNNQTDPANPVYTGKILALDTIYHLDNADGSTTVIRGNSTDPGNPMGPFQAPQIPFSWNSTLPNSQLPYDYTPDDPSQLQAIVTSPTAGAGAGVLTWAKTNWLLTAYPPTAPFLVTPPQNVTVNAGQSASFTAVAGGSGGLNFQWYFNTNTPVAGATNATLLLPTVQAANAGTYTVTVTNLAGAVTSGPALLAVSVTLPARPQVTGLAFANGAFSLTVNGDAGHNYIIQSSADLAGWTSIFTNYNPTMPFLWTDPAAGTFSQRFYRVQVGP